MRKIKNKHLLVLVLILIVASIPLLFYISSFKTIDFLKIMKLSPKLNTSNGDFLSPITSSPIVNTEILVSFAGDCTLGTDDNFPYAASLPGVIKAKGNDYSYLFKNVSSVFNSDDITTVNLETALTNSTGKRDKGPNSFNFKGIPEMAKALTLGGIEAVNISNNHINDYGSTGIADTKTSLKAENIGFFGEGTTYLKDIKGIKIGFLGYQGWSDDSGFLKKIKSDIEAIKKECNFVIINFHWGIEAQYYPNDVQKHIAHYAIDNGADLIIGHHPHVIEGIEKYKDKLICYSLGNFCFGGNSGVGDNQTFIFQVKLDFLGNNMNSLEVRAIPCSVSSVDYQNDYCPTPSLGSKKETILNKLNALSFNLDFKISDSFNKIYLDK
ncbi:MAG TPA: CapA family protein [Clostridiaceae bacterium]